MENKYCEDNLRFYVERKTINIEFGSHKHSHYTDISYITIYGNHELPLELDCFFMHYTISNIRIENYSQNTSFPEDITNETIEEDKVLEKEIISIIKGNVNVGKKRECKFVLGNKYADFCRLSNRIYEEEGRIWANSINETLLNCEKKRYDFMKSYILAHEFNLNVPLPNNGNSALGESFLFHDLDFAKILIERGAWYVEYESYCSRYEGFVNGGLYPSSDDSYYRNGEQYFKIGSEKHGYNWGRTQIYEQDKRLIINKLVHDYECLNSLSPKQQNFYNRLLSLLGDNEIIYSKYLEKKNYSKDSEWTQNLKFANYILSHLGLNYFKNLISNFHSHYDSSICENEFLIMELKYYIKNNNRPFLLLFLENLRNKSRLLCKMMVSYGIPILDDNEYLYLFYNCEGETRTLIENWRETNTKDFNNVKPNLNVCGTIDLKKLNNSVKNEHKSIKRTSTEEDLVDNYDSQLFNSAELAFGEFGHVLTLLCYYLRNNDEQNLYHLLTTDLTSQLMPELNKRIALGIYFAGYNQLVTAYMRSSIKSKTILDEWRKQEIKNYIQKDIHFSNLYYRYKDGRLTTQRISTGKVKYTIQWDQLPEMK